MGEGFRWGPIVEGQQTTAWLPNVRSAPNAPQNSGLSDEAWLCHWCCSVAMSSCAWEVPCQGERFAVGTSFPCLAFPAKGRGSSWLLGWERKEGLWGDKIWPTQLAHTPGFSVCFLKNVPVQNLPITILPWPHGNANYSALGWGFPPDENWKILAKAQLFQNSPGIRVIDGSFSLFTRCGV